MFEATFLSWWTSQRKTTVAKELVRKKTNWLKRMFDQIKEITKINWNIHKIHRLLLVFNIYLWNVILLEIETSIGELNKFCKILRPKTEYYLTKTRAKLQKIDHFLQKWSELTTINTPNIWEMNKLQLCLQFLECFNLMFPIFEWFPKKVIQNKSLFFSQIKNTSKNWIKVSKTKHKIKFQ